MVPTCFQRALEQAAVFNPVHPPTETLSRPQGSNLLLTELISCRSSRELKLKEFILLRLMIIWMIQNDDPRCTGVRNKRPKQAKEGVSSAFLSTAEHSPSPAHRGKEMNKCISVTVFKAVK